MKILRFRPRSTAPAPPSPPPPPRMPVQLLIDEWLAATHELLKATAALTGDDPLPRFDAAVARARDAAWAMQWMTSRTPTAARFVMELSPIVDRYQNGLSLIEAGAHRSDQVLLDRGGLVMSDAKALTDLLQPAIMAAIESGAVLAKTHLR